jgi:hypothetical protein
VSAAYDSFYSDKVVRMLNKFRKVRMVWLREIQFKDILLS